MAVTESEKVSIYFILYKTTCLETFGKYLMKSNVIAISSFNLVINIVTCVRRADVSGDRACGLSIICSNETFNYYLFNNE